MGRRFCVLVASAVFAFVGLATVGEAYAAPVAAQGAIVCFWQSGKITIKPGLVNGGTSPATVKFSGVIGQCENSEESGPAPFGITGGKMKGSFQIPNNACDFDTVGDSNQGGPGNATIRWTGSQKVAPTQVTTSDVGYEFGADNFASYPRSYFSNGVPTTGSFAGGGNAFVDADPTLEFTQRACMPKTKGLPGSGGLKKLDICPNTSCNAIAFLT